MTANQCVGPELARNLTKEMALQAAQTCRPNIAFLSGFPISIENKFITQRFLSLYTMTPIPLTDYNQPPIIRLGVNQDKQRSQIMNYCVAIPMAMRKNNLPRVNLGKFFLPYL